MMTSELIRKDLKVFIQFHSKNGRDNLLGAFRSYQADAKYIDLQIMGKDKSHTFNCHRLVLSVKSWLFHSILKNHDFQDDITSIIIPDMSSSLLIKFANYVYGGVFTDDIDNEALEWFKYLGTPTSNTKKDMIPIEGLEDIPFSYSCPFKTCSHVFYNQSDVKAHFISVHKPKTKNVVDKSDYKVMDSNNSTPDAKLLPHKCCYCNKSFAT